ncbi:MAG: ECF transporter S component [Lachnospiraceae bacterium]|nr:ECF transporter S component [Lachnospiraceae bacterium]
MNGLWQTIMDNVLFVAEFVGTIVAMFLIAYFIEKYSQARRNVKEKIFTTRAITMIGMFSALAFILFLIEFPLPFAPAFYQVDFSEIPVLIGTFAFGPVAGVMIEFCKILLKLLIKGTGTAFVGELANFAVGCALLLPASLVYERKKCKKNAILGLVAGSATMTIFAVFFNALYLLPTFSVMYGWPMDTLIAMGTKVNEKITDMTSFVVLAVGPLNIFKSVLVSIITMLIYKPLSVVIKGGNK